MITQIDFFVLNALQHMRSDILDFVMPYITMLGNGGIIWIIISVILLFSKKTRSVGLTVLLSLVIGWIISTIGLKNLIARERPFNSPNALVDTASLLITIPSDRFSFPSGHALSSFSAATVLYMYNKKIGLPALLLAVLIAFSRLYLYVHFPSDVIAGAVLGIIFALISEKTVNSIRRKLYEKKLPDNTE